VPCGVACCRVAGEEERQPATCFSSPSMKEEKRGAWFNRERKKGTGSNDPPQTCCPLSPKPRRSPSSWPKKGDARVTQCRMEKGKEKGGIFNLLLQKREKWTENIFANSILSISTPRDRKRRGEWGLSCPTILSVGKGTRLIYTKPARRSSPTKGSSCHC